jgi:hypothetical protein
VGRTARHCVGPAGGPAVTGSCSLVVSSRGIAAHRWKKASSRHCSVALPDWVNGARATGSSRKTMKLMAISA